MLEIVDIESYIEHEELPDSSYNFVVISMHTKGYEKVNDLIRSCHHIGIPHIICCVPGIHNSLSSKGEKYDFRFTKPNFIYNLCLYVKHKYPGVRNCLYVDSDVYFKSMPDKEISQFESDWGIYNWCGDPEPCQAYMPLSDDKDKGPWKISHGQIGYNPNVLFCSGTVIIVNVHSVLIENLLRAWQYYLRIFTLFVNANDKNVAAEDQILDLIWNNNLIEQKDKIKSEWLSKKYVRFPWWPWVKPIIKHPDLANYHQRPPTVMQISNYKTYEHLPSDTIWYSRDETPKEIIHPANFYYWET